MGESREWVDKERDGNHQKENKLYVRKKSIIDEHNKITRKEREFEMQF